MLDVVIDIANPVSGLNPALAKSLLKLSNKTPAYTSETEVYNLPGGGKAFQATSDGNVSGSSAIYEKQVDASGKTMEFTKTTLDPKGNVVHVKDKIKGTTIQPSKKVESTQNSSSTSQ